MLTKIRRKAVLILFAVAFLTSLSGCSSLLYYPTKERLSDPARFRHKPQDVFFQTEDGLKLHGWYFKTPKRPAKATVLFFHGNAQNLTSHFLALYWMLDQGFDYFIFDYRGYGESEGEPSPEGTIKDGKAAVAWIAQNKDPGTQLVIFAQSLGGAVGLRVACEMKDAVPYKAVIVDSTFPSYKKVARKALNKVWITWPFQWVTYLVLSDRYAPKSCIRDIAPRPLLVVHGTADRTVDFSLGEEVYELARDPKEFWRIEGGHHTDFLFREGTIYQEKLADWILKAVAN